MEGEDRLLILRLRAPSADVVVSSGVLAVDNEEIGEVNVGGMIERVVRDICNKLLGTDRGSNWLDATFEHIWSTLLQIKKVRVLRIRFRICKNATTAAWQ